MSVAVKNCLSTVLAGIPLDSLLFNASGTFNAPMFNRIFPLQNTMGAIVTKTVTQQPWIGNPQPRTHELPGIGMLNSIGLQNPGLSYCLETELPMLHAMGLPVMLSLSANRVEDFVAMIETLEQHQSARTVSWVELNLSCPNIAKGGVHFGRSSEAVHDVLQAVTERCSKPVFTKLPPNVEDIVVLAKAALEGGSTGITAINTVLGVAIDWRKRCPVMPRISAGYSGPGVKPIALHAIWSLYQAFPEVPIIGVGGIATAEDVLEFVMAGASVVQVGTACFRNPAIFQEMHTHLSAYCQAETLQELSSIRGCAHRGL
jgi:dihydroorotate dehydrogenase (NAD+) catalytic subunit